MAGETYERQRQMLSDMNSALDRESEARAQRKGGALGTLATAIKSRVDEKDKKEASELAERQKRRDSMRRTAVDRLPGEDRSRPARAGDSQDELAAFMRNQERLGQENAAGPGFVERSETLGFERDFAADQQARAAGRGAGETMSRGSGGPGPGQPQRAMNEEEKQKIMAEMGRSAATVIQAQQAAIPPAMATPGVAALPPPGSVPIGAPTAPAPDAPSTAAPGAPAVAAAPPTFPGVPIAPVAVPGQGFVSPNMRPVDLAAHDAAALAERQRR